MAVYEVVLNYLSSAGIANTVLHYDISGAEPFNFQAMVDVIRTDMDDHLATILAPDIVFKSITVRVDSPGSVGVTYTPTLGDLAGQSTDNQHIAQAAGLVRKKADNLVRPQLGRIYQPGITSEGVLPNSNWSTTVRDALEAFWSDMITISFAGPSEASMVIKAGNPSAPNTVPYNPVNSVEAEAIPATQRRRRKGVGV